MNRNNLPWYELPHLFLPESVKRKPTKKKSWAWEQKHVLLLLLLSRTTIAIITSIGRGICVAFLLVTLLCYIYSSNVRKKIGQHFFFCCILCLNTRHSQKHAHKHSFKQVMQEISPFIIFTHIFVLTLTALSLPVLNRSD